jgi:hypothetical protein
MGGKGSPGIAGAVHLPGYEKLLDRLKYAGSPDGFGFGGVRLGCRVSCMHVYIYGTGGGMVGGAVQAVLLHWRVHWRVQFWDPVLP